MKVEEIYLSETSVNFQQTMWGYVPVDRKSVSLPFTNFKEFSNLYEYSKQIKARKNWFPTQKMRR
jgi:hypothetical protein